jgi:hypothetical protein
MQEQGKAAFVSPFKLIRERFAEVYDTAIANEQGPSSSLLGYLNPEQECHPVSIVVIVTIDTQR